MKTPAGTPSVVRMILVFALLGPPIGYAVFLIWAAGENWLRHGRLRADLGSFLLFFPFSYLVGIIPALGVGAIVALIEARSRFKLLPVAATGIAMGWAFSVLIASYFNSVLLSVAICLVPTLVCWHLSRRWQQARLSRQGLR